MPSPSMHRLFFAIRPATDVRAHLADLVASLARDYDARWVKPARHHLTLVFLGTSMRFQDDLAAQAMRAGAAMHAAPFAWQADLVRGFPGGPRSACVLGATRPCGLLQDLRRDLLQALADNGVTVADRRAYVPHVTLGYGRDRPIASAPVSPMDFPVRGFALLHSVSGEANYRELGRWALAASA